MHVVKFYVAIMRIPRMDKIPQKLLHFAFDSNFSNAYHSVRRCRQIIEIRHMCEDLVPNPHMCELLVQIILMCEELVPILLLQ